MEIGIGLPVDDPDVLHEWAVRADAGPFSTLGLLDRLVRHNPEPLVTLAAAGLLTTPERVRDAVRAYAGLGADEVVLHCWATDVAQVDRMADLVS